MTGAEPDATAGDAVPAASLLLMRETAGAPELLIVRRHPGLAFAGGAYAFPGGRIDAADRTAAARHPGLAVDDAAARIAALRETAEETGIDLRRALPALAPMPLFGRWRAPPHLAPRRFDTRFYLARTVDAAEPRADGSETSEAFFATAAAMLDRCPAGDPGLLFPTRRLLERLARLRSFDEAGAQAAGLPDGPIEPVLDGGWLRIPEGRGYPVTAERAQPLRRG